MKTNDIPRMKELKRMMGRTFTRKARLWLGKQKTKDGEVDVYLVAEK